jgi:hypothetical protein
VLVLVGSVITIRRPRNAIGWIFCASGLLWAVGAAADGYAAYGLGSPRVSLPGAEVMAWLGSWTWAPPLGVLLTFLFLLFPDGRLPSRRWRPVAWLAAAATAGITMAFAFGQRTLEGHPGIPNPFGVPGATALEAAFLLLPPVSLATAVSLLLRFRRATGEARQQLKWFAAAAGAGVAALSVLASVLLGIAGATRSPTRWCWAGSPACRWPPVSRSCATGCTTSTGSSTAPWSTGSSPLASEPATLPAR